MVSDCRAGPLGLRVMDTALRLTRPSNSKDRPRPEPESAAAGDASDSSTSMIYNFPLHVKHRDAFLCAIAEVVAAHGFVRERLGCTTTTLPPAILAAVMGSVVRYRAVSGLVSSSSTGSNPLYRLPFTAVMAEPPTSDLSTSKSRPRIQLECLMLHHH